MVVIKYVYVLMAMDMCPYIHRHVCIFIFLLYACLHMYKQVYIYMK